MTADGSLDTITGPPVDDGQRLQRAL